MTGIADYGLLAGNFCEECGRAKMNRMFYDGIETGCKTCDKVTTRHRCTQRPDIGELADGQTWECAECGSTWTPATVTEDCPDCCADCGHQVTARRWFCTEGDRIETAPRYLAPYSGWWPYRDLLSARRPKPEALTCYVTPGGMRVHVKPGCRCPRSGR